MSRARNLADVISGSYDVPSAALGNVPPSAGKNLVINGGFQVWQRGTSGSANGSFVADRWTKSTNYPITHSRQAFANGQTAVEGSPKYYLRASAGATPNPGGTDILRYYIEGLDATGSQQTLTFSFWAKANKSVTIRVRFFDSFTWASDLSEFGSPEFSVTSSWQKFTATLTTSNHASKTITDGGRVIFQFMWLNEEFDGSDYLDVAQVKLERGSTATPFIYNTYAEELAACQRYYQVIGATGGTGGALAPLISPFQLRNGPSGWSGQATQMSIALPVEMRITPGVSVEYDGTSGPSEQVAHPGGYYAQTRYFGNSDYCYINKLRFDAEMS